MQVQFSYQAVYMYMTRKIVSLFILCESTFILFRL
jgi:hypothetical protein